ncbi:hypothetical protein BDD12DRAFT_810378 [Trichophaea hybrida]|nr:hypothetical protein BDD12DRAFT_810378 [Trichophaea hybrida]
MYLPNFSFCMKFVNGRYSSLKHSLPSHKKINLNLGKYTIVVQNCSPVDEQFFIFYEKPSVNDLVNGVFQNVFLSDIIASGCCCEFDVASEIYVVCGKTTLQNGACLKQTSASGQITLGTDSSNGTTLSMVVNNGAASFNTDPEPDAPLGTFQILTGQDFNEGDSYFVGIGATYSGSSQVTPLATIKASPDSTYNFVPHATFYAATGMYTPGTIFDISIVGQMKKVEFGQSNAKVIVTYQPNGTWH